MSLQLLMNLYSKLYLKVMATVTLSVALTAIYPAFADTDSVNTSSHDSTNYELRPLRPTLPPRYTPIVPPYREGQQCVEIRIPELSDPRFEPYCEYVVVRCWDPKTGLTEYISEVRLECGPYPTLIPDREDCEAQSEKSNRDPNFYSCEESAREESRNCSRKAICEYGIGLLECGLLPAGEARDRCVENVRLDYEQDSLECRLKFINQVSQCETQFPTEERDRRSTCLRTIQHYYELWLRFYCDHLRPEAAAQACYAAAEEAYLRLKNQCEMATFQE